WTAAATSSPASRPSGWRAPCGSCSRAGPDGNARTATWTKTCQGKWPIFCLEGPWMFEGKRILVTGGTGSWGHELVRQLLPQRPEEVIVFSRNESSQVAMSWMFDDPRLRFRIGDIRDREALTAACQGVDIVFHLAALKHVPVCE